MSTREARKTVLAACKKNDVKFVQLWFTDILGQLKAITLPSSRVEGVLEEGQSFDGSSVEGFARIFESDMMALPDPATFQVLPWTRGEATTARMICDIVDPHHKPFEGDPRYILKRVLARIARKKYTAYMGPEIEFFYFADSGSTRVLDHGGYFDLAPLDVRTELREKTVLTLQEMDLDVEASHHEVATSQHEIDLRFDEALRIADTIMTAKLVIKEIARQHGVYATFMPKPLKDQNGSGMHVHMSLFKNGKNAFYSRRGDHGMSTLAKQFAAGLLRHSREIAAVTNQWVNSYKRLVPGFEAPAYICWGSKNRSALVRVPLEKPEKDLPRRVEFRSPDPACNPYLAFAVMLGAGLKGIEEAYDIPEPVELDVFLMSEAERREHGIEYLPDSLYAATLALSESALVREVMGDSLFEKFVENKKIEWDLYRVEVTDYELKKYLPIL
jgi:glutamine synthetase